MDALRASSHLLTLASRTPAVSAAAARARLVVRCCSTSAAPIAAPGAPDRRRRSSTSTSDKDPIRAIRLKKVEELRIKGHDPYAYKWNKSHTAKQLQDMFSHLENGEEYKEDLVLVAGRIIARRAFGKLVFLTLRDDSGTIQACGFD